MPKAKKITDKELNQPIQGSSYAPDAKDKALLTFIDRRVKAMQDWELRKDAEKIWKKADKDYEIQDDEFNSRKRFESDDELGLRSRLVPVESAKGAWKDKSKQPTLLVKIQTALSVLTSTDLKAFFQPTLKKYDKRTNLAKAIWQYSWNISNGSRQVLLFIFNLCKYGWACARTYPKIIKREKSILTSIDTEDPTKNTYETRTITEYNNVYRENLDPFKTWIDEMTVPEDPSSTNDWYFEKEYNYDSAELEFNQYPNWKYVKQELDKPLVVGFYENKNKDIYAIRVPEQGILLFNSPLPNDDGKLSLWHTYWILRKANNPYGIGLYEIIKSNKELYDKFSRMTMNQLKLAVEKMFFYTGTNSQINDGQMEVEAGKGYQNLGGKVEWLDVPTPGQEAWQGLEYLKSKIDDDSGINATIEGKLTGKQTFGEIRYASESSLKRLAVPLQNIATALSQEAYISLSWLSQILSVPEIKEFANIDELMAYEKESGTSHFELQEDINELGETNKITSTYLPQIPLGLDMGKDQQLIESNENRFFQVGKDIQPEDIKWEGIITIDTRSIIAPTPEADAQKKLEMFNILAPILSQDPAIYAKPAGELIKSNNEELEDWLPKSWLDYLETGQLQPQMNQMAEQTQGQPESMQAGAEITPMEAQQVVPNEQINA